MVLFQALRRNVAMTSRRNFSSGGGGGGGSLIGVAALGALGFGGYQLYEQQQQLQNQINGLQVEISGQTNSAFLFLKPHACKGTPGKVEALVEDSLKQAGIRITGSGSMPAEVIDKKRHIDTHYGAIASKAVVLKPSELIVPEAGKIAFQKAFGESWESALAAGKVYNAADAASKLNLDAAGMNAAWSKLIKGKTLLKFGGGFYCGKLEPDVYVMNGFYMSMRNAYTAPGERIQWYTVSWPVSQLSWADFRGQVLGATDPSAAAPGSVRRALLDQYKKLGLKTKPNTGDNGVHASASPLEAYAERANWLGVSGDDDAFGKALKAKGLDEATIQAYFEDCQVRVQGETEPGQTMSVFDALEDLDSDAVLQKVSKISK